eukprot:2850006-Amphidinium_carterae.1
MPRSREEVESFVKPAVGSILTMVHVVTQGILPVTSIHAQSFNKHGTETIATLDCSEKEALPSLLSQHCMP